MKEMSRLREMINETASYLKEKIGDGWKIGIILGSGLGGLVDYIEDKKEIPYNEIPNFPVSTVEGHRGSLVFGKIGDKKVVAMSGRFHYYEGWSMQEVTFPVRVMKALGVELLIVSNAAGGLNREFEVGDLMIITDQINAMGTNPLIGPNDDELGPRFPDMTNLFSKRLIALAQEIALEVGVKTRKGVYVAVTGPTYETPAECRMYRLLGADAIGMSTVPEVIVARHAGIKEIFGISVITDMATGEGHPEVSHEEVLKVARSVEPKFVELIKRLIERA